MDLYILCLTPGTSEITIWLCPADTVGVHLTFIWLKDTYLRRWGVVLQQKFQTLTSNFVEMLCITNSENHVTLAANFLT